MNFAGANRLLAGSDAVLQLAERADLSLALRSVIAISTGGLRGVDRKKPFGFMTLIDPGEVPEPVAIGYIPVSNQNDAIAVLKSAGVVVTPVKDKSDRFDLTVQKVPLAMRFFNGYAFIARQQTSLNRKFADPAVQFRKITKQYDVAIRIPLVDVPAGMRTMILDYFRARGELSAPRRRGETGSSYALRSAMTNASLAGLESFLKHGESLTLGMSVTKSKTPITIDLTVVARENTSLAKTLAGLHGGKFNRFSFSPDGKSVIPFAMACRCRLPEMGRAVLSAWIVQMVDSLSTVRRSDRNAESPVSVAVTSLFCDSQTEFTIREFGFGETQQWVVAIRTANPQRDETRIKSALQTLQKNGAVREFKTHQLREPALSVSRISWGDSQAVIAIDGRVVWIVSGTGDLSNRLVTAIQSAKRVAKDRPPTSESLMELSFQSRLLGATGSADNRKSQEAKVADSLRFRIAQHDRQLRLQATLEPDVVRSLGQWMASLLPRIR